VDGGRGAPPGRHGVDDRLGTGNDVAAGEDPGAAGCKGVRVGHDAGPAAHFDAGALGEDGWIGFFADRHEDGAGRTSRIASATAA